MASIAIRDKVIDFITNVLKGYRIVKYKRINDNKHGGVEKS